jgi:hypothetical protein
LEPAVTHPLKRSPRHLPFLALMAVAALASGTAALAEDRDPGTPEAAREQAATGGGDPSDKICRRVRPVGSNIPQTICRTRQQMDAEEAQAREALDDRRGR